MGQSRISHHTREVKPQTPERNRQQDTQPGFFNKQIARQNQQGGKNCRLKENGNTHQLFIMLTLILDSDKKNILQNITYKTNRNLNSIWIFDNINILLNF